MLGCAAYGSIRQRTDNVKRCCFHVDRLTFIKNTRSVEESVLVIDFYARQLYRQVLLRARISYGSSVRLSVCPSVTTRYGFKARLDRDSGSSPYDSLQSPVSYEVIWCHWVKRFPSNKGTKERYPLRNRYFITIGSSSVKTVADRHRLAASHNKHC